MECLTNLLESSTIPLLTAFLLGLLTAISPCPLASNITAIGFISKNLKNSHSVFWNGILYTIGRIITYAGIALILIPILRAGASIFVMEKTIGKYGEIIIGPTLILIGLFMLFGNKLNLSKFGYSGNGLKKHGSWGALFLGILLALAFCPTSGVFYFGMLIPMAAAETGGYLLPIVFAIATGIPVIIVAWILAYSITELGKFYRWM
ncbi:MAG: aromatic aminobenezylarsenical efflux permease ArsG family transporter, partial [Bacteroidales bacterium]